MGLNERVEALPQIKTPLHFTAEQEEMMVEATLPDNLIYYLKLNNSFLVDKMNDDTLYKLVIQSIPETRTYDLSGTRDILNFICLKLIYKDQFNQDTELKFQLNQLKVKELNMNEVMALVLSKTS